MFFNKEQDSHLAESLRILRTNLHFMEEKKNRIVIFTSTIPKEGKSTVSANYAMSVAMSGEKVLIVDCDIRRPRAHSSFGIEVNKGLGEILLEKESLEDVILKDIEPNLDILPSTHLNHNVTELFLGNRMKNLLLELRKRYDLIVLDTPPLVISTDAVILSEYSDGVVYVCGYDMVSKKQLVQSRKILDRAKANIYGVVVNKIDKDGYSYGNYGYYNYNYKYYDEYSKGEK
ncbi:MAG TPA: capsular biosynthesis protein [Fusobacteriaceae bacterium]|nr:capsular biosynthesis protein [Fusobacteriaceae bacterium]